jgi:hypothetical protein
VVTDDRGRYIVPALTPGTYRIVVKRDGFSEQTREASRSRWGRRRSSTFRRLSTRSKPYRSPPSPRSWSQQDGR